MARTEIHFADAKESAVFRLDGREVRVRLNPRFGEPDQSPVLIECFGEMDTRLSVQSIGPRQMGLDVLMVGDETVDSAAHRKERASSEARR